ncbi:MULTISPECIES: hypothetical protein [Oceanobacillus]|uniref:hypothetical protein n=1 Tax=Oceanobacillus TaxID=182709 RepID=UPI0030FC2E8B
MVDAMLDFMLGPFRNISAFYFENQLIFNSIVLGLACYKLFVGKKKNTKNDSAN